MSERMVRLDVRAQADVRADSRGAQQGGEGLDERAAEENVDRFRRALGDDNSGAASTRDAQSVGNAQSFHTRDAEEESTSWRDRGAFGLFGSLTPPSPAHIEPHLTTTSGVAESGASRLASEVADRILVSADDGREARVFIRDDVMPGVEVRITQEQGRWLVAFTISDGKSFEVLAQAGQKMADELTVKLKCEVEVQLIPSEQPDGSPTHTFFSNAENDGGAQ